MPTEPKRELETFPNPKPERDYEIFFEAPEFTCLCPKTGQPDFATLRISYVPDEMCVDRRVSSSTCGPTATRAPSTRR